MTVDFHSHTRESDGTLAPDALVALMRARGVAVFSITDHDTLRAYDGLEVEGPALVRGIEINTTWNGGDVHVLGYGVPLGEESPLGQTLAANREHRRGRVAAMVAGLRDAGYPIAVADVVAQARGGHALGRPHVAKALAARGFVRDTATAFRDLLRPGQPGYQPSSYITPHEAVDVIARSGGVPVLAHPGRLKDESIVAELVEAGLTGLEVFYPAHTAAQTAHFRSLADRFDLVMSAGADFHDARSNPHGVGMVVDAGDLRPFLEMVIHD